MYAAFTPFTSSYFFAAAFGMKVDNNMLFAAFVAVFVGGFCLLGFFAKRSIATFGFL